MENGKSYSMSNGEPVYEGNSRRCKCAFFFLFINNKMRKVAGKAMLRERYYPINRLWTQKISYQVNLVKYAFGISLALWRLEKFICGAQPICPHGTHRVRFTHTYCITYVGSSLAWPGSHQGGPSDVPIKKRPWAAQRKEMGTNNTRSQKYGIYNNIVLSREIL